MIALLSALISFNAAAQQISFPGLGDARHLMSVHTGVDYGSYYGLSYGYVVKRARVPMVIGTEFTLPFGDDIADDWKWKTGLEAGLLQRGALSVTFKPSVLIRRYESSLVRMYNFGVDLALSVGYVKSRWGAVAVAGFDKAIVTHLEHGLLRDYYPEIKDGWYLPTGGNFRFGARVHYGIGRWTAFAMAGKHFGQDFRDNPTMPFFGEVSLQTRLGSM